ncbi:MAG TPA: ribose-5-phosphate isomerase RpiA [Ktedonosporobacter sp.]|nr:ribose-5-phosphate isomerase RpiA [Ktedonosporobacter sp.]
MTQQNSVQDSWKQLAGSAAAQLIEDGMLIGLGTGSTAAHLLAALAQRIQAGLRIKGAIPSSQTTRAIAEGLGIPLTDLDTYSDLDLYIDGADEIDPQLQLIKGAGGALLREKIVASCARRFVVIADTSKLVSQLGLRYPVPVETIPFAVSPVRKRLESLGALVQVRQHEGRPYITDNNNMILDCTFQGGISDSLELDAHMHSIVGVVETGLFLRMAQQAIIGGPNGVQVLP